MRKTLTRRPATPTSPATGVKNPDAGVIATNPQTAPNIPPSTLGLPVRCHSIATHPSVPAAAAKCVAAKALVASEPADSALPALNPNQPTQSMQAPMTLRIKLCGGIGVRG